MDIFNNREMALIAWACIIFLYLFFNPKTHNIFKKGIVDVIRALFHPALIRFFALYILYLTISLFCLSGLELWDFFLLKGTVIWFLTVGFVTVSKINNTSDHTTYFKEWLLDNLKAIVLIEYLISLYSFSFFAEFIILPVLSLLAIMSFMAEKDPKHKSVKVLCDWLLTIFGFYLIGHALQEAYFDLKNLETAATLKDVLSPFFLSLSMLPFLYSLFIYFTYERVFTGIDFGIKNEQLKKYAKFYSALNFGTDVDFLERWKRKIFLTDIKTKEDLKKSFKEIKKVKRREKNPTQVEVHEGWFPPHARKFLQNFGMVTNDYHESFDADWTASSNDLEIEDGYKLSNRIWYYINGDADKVKKFTLKLYINNLDIRESSEDKFLEIFQSLLGAAAVHVDDQVLVSFLKSDSSEIIVNNYTKLTSLKTTWEGGIKGGYDRKLIIENIS